MRRPAPPNGATAPLTAPVKEPAVATLINEADDVAVFEAANGTAALLALRERRIDCVLAGPGAFDLEPEVLVKEFQALPLIRPVPVVLYGAGAAAPRRR